MSSSYEEQRKEIEEILKEIYKKYRKFSRDRLYYKVKSKSLTSLRLRLAEDFSHAFSMLFDPNLEYALYIDVVKSDIVPSLLCIRNQTYYYAIIQFIASFSAGEHVLFSLFLTGVTDASSAVGKDPLFQLFMYRHLLTAQGLQRVYMCPNIYIVRPYGSDPTSIFSGKCGIIAYCMAFNDFLSTEIGTDITYIYSKFRDIVEKAEQRLRNNKGLYELWEHNKEKACDINLIKSIIHDEIEEAERIMRKYGIIRVAFRSS